VIKRLNQVWRRVRHGRNLSGLKRADYRAVWDALATTEDDAKTYVAGYTDEAELLRTAEQVRDTLQSTVGIQPDDIVLEIGAGIGRVGQVLAPICKVWIGADVSRNMLRHLRRRLGAFPNVRTVLVDGYDLAPIPSESVDLVYCTVVFMHLDERDRFRYVVEGMRVLKPGGRLFVDNFSLLSDEGWRFFLEAMNGYRPRQRPPHLSKSSTPDELHAYFQRAGFQRIEQRSSGPWIMTYGVKPA